MKPSISFWAAGDPKGQPRPRAFARRFGKTWQARVYDPGTAEAWKSAIAEAAKPYLTRFEGPVHLHLWFSLRRPKAHYRKNGELKDGAPFNCITKPDADNYAKAVMDALTQIGLWRDDCQVASLSVRKTYGDRVGAQIEIEEMER